MYKPVEGRSGKGKGDAENRIVKLVQALNCIFLEDNGGE
jgi:hypothetical protein